jgi:hypothetical protein
MPAATVSTKAPMKLIQILLPLSDNQGRRYDDAVMRDIQKKLAARFGGMTAYTRAPAEGLWGHGEDPTKDDIVVVEVMAETFDRDWWGALKKDLEERLAQEEIVIRAQPLETL